MKLAWCCVLLAVLAFAIPAWANELPMDDVWWERQYQKIHKTEECSQLKSYFENLRSIDQREDSFLAPSILGWHYWKEPCFESDFPLAEKLLTWAAERGNFFAPFHLAQFQFLTKGENARKTKEWLQRAKNAMVRLNENWKQKVYDVLTDRFKRDGQPFSPELEQAFSWYESIEKGPAETFYEIGMDLLNNGNYPESKLLACRWLSKAETAEHVKARFQLARQAALGDGVRVNPDQASLLLQISANTDRNADAFLLAAELLQKGDIFEKNLMSAYAALLKAQAYGLNVSKQLRELEPLLTDDELKRSKRRGKDDDWIILLYVKTPHSPQPSCLYFSR